MRLRPTGTPSKEAAMTSILIRHAMPTDAPAPAALPAPRRRTFALAATAVAASLLLLVTAMLFDAVPSGLPMYGDPNAEATSSAADMETSAVAPRRSGCRRPADSLVETPYDGEEPEAAAAHDQPKKS
jgi:hypothetical protein